MMFNPLRAFLLTVFFAGPTRASRKECYPVVGCFSNAPPFNNALSALPQSPADIGSSFTLFTRNTTTDGESLEYSYLFDDNVGGEAFNPNASTIFIVHGFLNSAETPWIVEMRKALLDAIDANVIEVVWEKGARHLYQRAAANTRVVGTELELLIRRLQRQKGLRLEDVHIIGHSLGAHIAGYAGALLLSKVGRITGLDPAGLFFESNSEEVRLDASDAVFVDAIHTNGHRLGVSGGFGTQIPSGHIDFYPNGGDRQPGCAGDGAEGLFTGIWDYYKKNGSVSVVEGIGEEVACSHGRAHEIFTESLKPLCVFTAHPCTNYDDFIKGQCSICPEHGCNLMGFPASPDKALGQLFTKTNSKIPLCTQESLTTLTP